MATLDEILNGLQQPAPLPAIDPNIPMAQAGSNMSTMGGHPNRAVPPVDEQDFAQRTSGWSQFLQGLRNDPNFSQALLFMGARMLQPPRPGQTTGGVLGEAVLGGTQMYGALNQSNADAQRQAEKDALDAEGKRAQIESSRTTVAKTKQDMKLEAENAPAKRREAEALAKWREAQARKDAAEAAGLEAIDPARMAQIKLDAAQAEVNARNASAASSYASAGLHNEQRKWVEPNALASIGATQALTAERLSSTAKNFGVGGSGGDKTALGFAKLDLDTKKAVVKAHGDALFMGQIPAYMSPADYYEKVWNSVPMGQKPGTPAPSPGGVGFDNVVKWGKDANGNPVRLK